MEILQRQRIIMSKDITKFASSIKEIIVPENNKARIEVSVPYYLLTFMDFMTIIGTSAYDELCKNHTLKNNILNLCSMYCENQNEQRMAKLIYEAEIEPTLTNDTSSGVYLDGRYIGNVSSIQSISSLGNGTLSAGATLVPTSATILTGRTYSSGQDTITGTINTSNIQLPY
jgi:hypothetical protein